MKGAYYNEIDPIAAEWLRRLIAAGHIAACDVDERSIVDVRPADLRGYRQCHFFAGIGVWSYALRRAGWDDDREVWTGSCPCQPFSDAGAGGGFDDERHLFPAWSALIRECRPVVVFGEQVASKDGLAWLDLVHADLEAADYTVGAVDLCAAGVGAPHIRQRFFFVADAGGSRTGRHTGNAQREAPKGDSEGNQDRGNLVWSSVPCGAVGGVVNPDDARREGDGLQPLRGERQGRGTHERAAGSGAVDELGDASSRGRRECGDAAQPWRGRHADGAIESCGVAQGDTERAGRQGFIGPVDVEVHRGAQSVRPVGAAGASRCGLADADGGNAGAEGLQRSGEHRQQSQDCRSDLGLADDHEGGRAVESSTRLHDRGESRHDSAGRGPTNGFWRDAVWIPCRDGKARPIEPGSFPLAHGAPARVGRLRAYGNAINAEAAREFIAAYLDVRRAA